MIQLIFEYTDEESKQIQVNKIYGYNDRKL